MTAIEFIQSLGMARNPKAAARLIETTFNEGQPDQYKRELVWNAVQAKARNIYATAVRLDAPDVADPNTAGIKAAFVDDGVGMASGKIVDYIGELFNGESAIGVDGNFQMGARVSTLPFNRAGLLVASWTEAEPEGAMLHIAYDPQSATYGVASWEVADGVFSPTCEPPDYLHHDAIKRAGHGTVFVLLGNEETDHTVGRVGRDPATGRFIYPSLRKHEVDWHYYNTKFWALPEGVTLHMMWGPQHIAPNWMDRLPPGFFFEDIIGTGPEGYFSHRRLDGLDSVITKDAKTEAGEATRGQVQVTSGRGQQAAVHWALFPQSGFERSSGGGDSSTRDYGIPLGVFGEKLGNELYALRTHAAETRAPMEWYGIARRELRDRLVLVVEPAPESPSTMGATPSSARDRLLIANAALPHDEWGAAFAVKMPEPIKRRLAELNGEQDKGEASRLQKLLARLTARFGRPLRATPQGEVPTEVGERVHAVPRVTDTPDPAPSPPPSPPRPPRPSPGHKVGPGEVPVPEAKRRADQRKTREPKPITPQWAADEFEGRESMIAKFNAATRTLFLNDGHPVVQDVIVTARAGRRPDAHDEIAALARDAIAEHLIAMIYSVELFMTSSWGQVGSDFLKDATSEHALTAAALNIDTIERLVHAKFKGRTGFGRVEDGAA